MKDVTKMTGRTINIFPEPKKAIGLLGVGTGRKIHSDKDKDGVKDVLDCAPNDPTKQAWYHRAGKYAAEKLLYKGHIEKAKAYISERERKAEEIKKIRLAERHKQRLKIAKFREEEKGKRQREFIKAGGIPGVTRKALTSAAKAIAPPRKVRTGKGYRTVYKKKGKRYVKTRVPTKQGLETRREYKPFSLGDIPKIPI